MSYKCESGCDNRYYNCPPRMSDGRHFTDYRPRCAVTFEAQPHAMTSFDSRQFFIHNGESMINKNKDDAIFKNACAPCVEESTMLPEVHVQVCNDRVCNFRPNDADGVGVGRGYAELFQTMQNPDAVEKQKYCDVKRYNDLELYPWDGNFASDHERLATQSGGKAGRGSEL